jgi:hypothetical protein
MQIESMSENRDGGPMWGKFFEDLGGAAMGDDDTASHISGSQAPEADPATPVKPKHLRGISGISSVMSPYSELAPNDSASALDDGGSEVGGAKVAGAASSVAPAPPPVDDGTYIFKFRTPSGRTHRFQARNDNCENLRDIVAGKLLTDPFFTAEGAQEGDEVHLPDPAAFTMSYTDDDGDLVTMTTDSDVTDAVRIARSQKSDRVVIYVSGGKGWEQAARDLGVKAVETLKEAETTSPADDTKALEDKGADPAQVPTYGQSEKVHSHSKPVHGGLEEKVMGIPKDLLLPASVGFLGVVILGVFIATRSSKAA